MLRVNKSFVTSEGRNDKTNKKRLLTYGILLTLTKEKNKNFDKYSFFDSQKVFPFPYDITDIKMDSGKIRIGWYTGQSWFCRGKKHYEKITGWRKKSFKNDEFTK